MSGTRSQYGNGGIPLNTPGVQFATQVPRPIITEGAFNTRVRNMLGDAVAVSTHQTAAHSTTGIPYAVAGSATVIQQQVGAHLAGTTTTVIAASGALHVFLCNYCYVYLHTLLFVMFSQDVKMQL